MSAIDSFSSYLPPKKLDGTEKTKLHKLRYHLAVEGCTHSQLSLAKSFLQDAAETNKERKENAELAVRWLVLATSEGNSEALGILENCYKMGVGVTDVNREDVERCLRSTNKEKLAQRVGCNIFRLIAYDTNEPIPLEYFQQHISLYLKAESITEDHHSVNIIYSSGLYITTQDVVKSVYSCFLGKCPAINLDTEPRVYDFQPDHQKSYLKHSVIRLNNLIKMYLNCLLVFCSALAELSLCLTFFVFFSIVLCVPALLFVQSPKNILPVLEQGISYYAFMIIMVTSARMVISNKNKRNCEKWEKVIRMFDSTAAAEIPHHSAEKVFLRFILILISIAVFLLFDDFQSDNLILFGKWTLLSFCMIKADLEQTSAISRLYLVLSFFTSFARLSPQLPVFNWLLMNLYSVNFPVINQTFVIQPVGVISCFAMATFLVVFCSHSFRFSINLITTSFWFHIIFKDLHHVETTLVCVILMSISALSIKKLGFSGAIFLAFLTLNFVNQSNFISSLLPTLAFLFSVKITEAIISLKKRYNLTSVQIYSILMLVTSLSCAFMLPNFSSVLDIGTHENISWSKYSKECHRPAWSELNMVHTQVSCDKFKGWTVNVEGHVENVYRKSFTSIGLPNVLGYQLSEPFVISTYEITLHIKGTFSVEAEIFIQANDLCNDFIFDLQQGDLLSVIGRFEDGLGTSRPVITLESAECISCMEVLLCKDEKTDLVDFFIPKFVRVVQFFFYPWIK